MRDLCAALALWLSGSVCAIAQGDLLGPDPLPPDIAGLPPPSELRNFPECACEQADFPPLGRWRIDMQSGTSADLADSLIGREPLSPAALDFYSRDAGLTRPLCGERIAFPGGIQLPLVDGMQFAREGSGDGYDLDEESTGPAINGHLSFRRGAGGEMSRGSGQVTALVPGNFTWEGRFDLILQSPEQPGMVPSEAMARVNRLTGRGLDRWSDLPCWCREIEWRYGVAFAAVRAYGNSALLAAAREAGAAGAWPGEARLAGPEALADIRAGSFNRRTIPGALRPTRLVTSHEDAVTCAIGHLVSGALTQADIASCGLHGPTQDTGTGGDPLGGGTKVGATTDLNDCTVSVPRMEPAPIEAMLLIHEGTHAEQCHDLHGLYARRSDVLSGVFRGPGHFTVTANNDPDIGAVAEVAAYAAELRFALDFYGAHCRPILDRF